MTRMIDAVRFGEIMEQWKKDCLADNDTQGADIISDVILQLDDMPTLTPPNEWVSVEERLPEPTHCVLVYTTDYSVEVDAIGSDGEWMAYEVTHWTPLPAPPDRRPPEGEA